jgi:hypothetical protein
MGSQPSPDTPGVTLGHERERIAPHEHDAGRNADRSEGMRERWNPPLRTQNSCVNEGNHRVVEEVEGVGEPSEPRTRFGGSPALPRPWSLQLGAHSAHRDHQDRRIVITVIGHRDHVSERSDEQSRQEWA